MISIESIQRVLAGVIAALERLTLTLPAAASDAEKLDLFRRCYHEIIAVLNTLQDAELHKLKELAK